jgi:hypothetical protein
MSQQAHTEKETAGQMLQRLGMDGQLWAEEMHKRFPAVSVDDMIGWCCNMVMAGYDEAERRVKTESQALRDENRELRAIVEMYRGELSVMADYLDEGEITHARIKAENRVNKTIALIDAALTKGAL